MDRHITRRAALTTLTGAALATTVAGPALAQASAMSAMSTTAKPPPAPSGYRRITLVNAHTGETFSDAYALGNRYSGLALIRLRWLLRDHHSGTTKMIDPAVIDVLARIQTRVMKPIIVLSAYRSPFTNLRIHITDRPGVPENSFHTRGKAIDFTVEGYSAEALGHIARQSGTGGLGIYASNFVHVDTGPVRNWTG
ncbi:MAG: YcbK family protein [Alphaproteobacteria bacterium]|nr:YcbK family protein [Alphaproteobacteria bacterium]